MSTGPRLVASLAVLLAAACGGTQGTKTAADNSTMRPGEDCLSCHNEFTAAGTVYAAVDATSATSGVSGATVTIDGTSASVILTTNAAGNFYTTKAFGFPATVIVSKGGTTRTMNTSLASRSGCAASNCHPAVSSLTGQPFRVHVP